MSGLRTARVTCILTFFDYRGWYCSGRTATVLLWSFSDLSRAFAGNSRVFGALCFSKPSQSGTLSQRSAHELLLVLL